MRLLLADDHALFRAGLRRILEEEVAGVHVEEVSDLDALSRALEDGSWDLLVLDVTMQGRNSLDVLPSLRRDHPGVPVLILSMHAERQFVVRALRAGARAYVTKESAPAELIRALRMAAAGQRYVCEPLAGQLADFVAGDDRSPHERLSPRELEVFLLLAAARSVSAIGERLGLSVKTVSTHRSRILEKTGLRSNAEIMRYAVEHRLGG